MHPAAEGGFDEAMAATEFLDPFHIIADAGIALEIGLDVALRLALRDAELLAQTERAEPRFL